jgi:2-desacetyl-2-hydroxyethyl bacteriochlorophyllide A dehydrogenase
MNALVYLGPRRLEVQKRSVPELRPESVLIRVKAVGICGSDVHGYTGESGRRMPPLVMGHEFAGFVEAVAPGVDASWVGRAVTVQPVLSCGRCDQCTTGRSQRCRSRSLLGANCDGAMAEFVVVPGKNLVPLSLPADFVSATLAEPAAVAYHAVRRPDSLEGRLVLVCGGGPIGLFTALMAREAGAKAVVISEIQESRRHLAMALGADSAVDPAASDVGSALRVFDPQGEADISVDAVGIQPTVEAAIKYLKPGGEIVLLGGWKTLSIPMGTIVAKEARLLGSFNYLPEEFAAAANWVSLHRDVCRAVVSHTSKLQEGAEAFRRLEQEPSQIMKMVLIVES